MKIRGRRACQSCETEWSYYETGSIECPNCGSLHSVGIDNKRNEHTDTPTDLSLSPFRSRVANDPIDQYSDDLKRVLREYTRKRGFIHGGELRELDDTYLCVRELLHVVDLLTRSRSPTEDEELYFLTLFDTLCIDQDPADTADRAADWPAPSAVPAGFHDARGLAVTESIESYVRDLRTWLEAHPDSEATATLQLLRDQRKRADALGGDISPPFATELAIAARELGKYLRTGDLDALASARDRLQQR